MLSFLSRLGSKHGADATRIEHRGSRYFLSLNDARGWPFSAEKPAEVARRSYQSNPIAFRCVRMIAEATASVGYSVSCEQEEVRARVEALLRSPSPDMSGAEFWETVFGHLMTFGNAFVERVGPPDGTFALYPVRPDQVDISTDETGWPVSWRVGADKGARTLHRDPASGRAPVLHLKVFNPIDDVYGMAPMSAAQASIALHSDGAAWTRALLRNGARPSGALVWTGDTALSDDQFDRLKAQMEDAHQGAGNAGRPLLLEGGLDWKPLSLSPADMDFVEARREAAREIALAFGVPPLLLGLPGDAAYANYKEANLAFWRQSVLPLARKSAQALSVWLRPWIDRRLEIKVRTETIPALASEQRAHWESLQRAEFLSTEEKRALAGFEGTKP